MMIINVHFHQQHSATPLCKWSVCAGRGGGSEAGKFDSSKVRKETNKESKMERSEGCQCDLAEVGMETPGLVTSPHQCSNDSAPFGDITNCFQNSLHQRGQSLLTEASRSAMDAVNGAACTSNASQHALSLERAPTDIPNAGQLQSVPVHIIINGIGIM